MYEAERLRLLAEAQEEARAARASGGMPPPPPPPPPPASPTPSPSQPDPQRQPTGEELRDEAEQRVEDHADEEWMARAYEQLGVVLRDHERFNTDPIWALLDGYPERTHERKAMSAVLRRAQREGRIRPTSEYVKSSRPECHARHVRMWERV